MEDKIQKIKDFFSALSFDEGSHTYYVNNLPLATSVSQKVKDFVEHVPFDQISYNIDNRMGLPQGTTQTMWKLKADAKCALGTQVHFFGEHYPFCRDLKPTNGYEVAITKFWDTLPSHIVPVIMELRMWDLDKGHAGTADIILYNTSTEKFIIADYKTNEDLFKNFNGKTLLPPFEGYLENDFNKYQIQLSEYQLLFEQTGFEIEKRVLIWLKPDGEYIPYETEDLTSTLKSVE